MTSQIYTTKCMSGQRCLITGASSGIGRAVALQMAELGASVILVGRDIARLESTRARMNGGEHHVEPFNLADADDVADWVKSISQKYGELTSIFHAAGKDLVRAARLTKSAHIADAFASSVWAAFGLARAAASKGIMADGGSIVFMSSVAGLRGTAGMIAYSSAKASIDGLTRSLACELAPRKIRVNSVAAGAIQTEMHDRLAATLGNEGLAEYERKHLLGFGSVEDVCHAGIFLLSPAARWITGTTLVVDGGYLAR